MDYEIGTAWDEGSALHYPYVKGDARPPRVRIEHNGVAGAGFPSVQELEKEYVPLKGTELWVPAREAYIAFGGDLPYDIVLEIGFNGTESFLLETRFRQRPDLESPVTITLIRTIRLDTLVRRAISENRTAYRRTSETDVISVSPEERRLVYLPRVSKVANTSRRRVTDRELKRVADVYIAAVENREPPTLAVEKKLGLRDRNLAKKRVQMARAAGYLPPSPGERRGGTA